jgi:dTDP-4-dehydrorhamnose 3,5-epimerase-like enzyme
LLCRNAALTRPEKKMDGNTFAMQSMKCIADERGKICILDRDMPFVAKRCFWITDADGQTRGGHRHHVTRQLLVALRGRVDVYMNNGREESTVALDDPARYLLVEPQDWHTMTFGPGSVLLVLASHEYQPEDYIYTPYEK